MPLFVFIPKAELITPSTLYQEPTHAPKDPVITILQVPIDWSWSSRSVVLNCGYAWKLM